MSSHLERARMLIDVHRYRDAVPLVLEHLAEEPNSVYAHAMLSRCYLQMKQLPAALKAAQEAIHHEPDYGYAHYIHSFVLRDLKRHFDARRAIREALRLEPHNADFLSQSADLFNLREKYDDAIRDAERGLALDPMHVECACDRAFALMCKQQFQRADAALKEILAAHPDQSRIHATMGWVAVNCRKYKLARQYFSEALRIDPENKWAEEGMEESRQQNFVWRFIASREPALTESLPSVFLVAFLAWIFQPMLWMLPWHEREGAHQAETPGGRVYSSLVFAVISLIIVFALCGTSLAKIGLLGTAHLRAGLQPREIIAAIAGWSLLLIGMLLMAVGSYADSRSLHGVGCVAFWVAISAANAGKYRSPLFRGGSVLMGFTYLITGMACVGKLIIPQSLILQQLANQHWLLIAFMPVLYWSLNYLELHSEPEA